MIMKNPDDEICDIPFSLRISKTMSDKINERAKADGLKTSAWVRLAIEYALENLGSSERKVSKRALIEMIENDSDVQDILYQKIAEKMRLTEVLEKLSLFAIEIHSGDEGEDDVSALSDQLDNLMWDIYNTVPSPYHTEGLVHISSEDFYCYLDWTDEFALRKFQKMKPEELNQYAFFYLEAYEDAGPKYQTRGILRHPFARGLYFWGRDETPDLKKITSKYPHHIFTVHAASLKLYKGKYYDGLIDYIVRILKYAAKDTAYGPVEKLFDPECREFTIVNLNLKLDRLPVSLEMVWYSENWKNGVYEDGDELAEAIENGEDNTLRPEIRAKWDSDPDEEEYCDNEYYDEDSDEQYHCFKEECIPLARRIKSGDITGKSSGKNTTPECVNYVNERIDLYGPGDDEDNESDEDEGYIPDSYWEQQRIQNLSEKKTGSDKPSHTKGKQGSEKENINK